MGSNDPTYLEALLQKRIEFARQLRGHIEVDNSVAQGAVALYTEIITDIISDVIAEIHREVKTGTAGQEHFKKAREYKVPLARPAKGKLDVFGNSDAVGLSEEVVCSHCGRKIAASRFAPHLEKCMGKGRNASRANMRRS